MPESVAWHDLSWLIERIGDGLLDAIVINTGTHAYREKPEKDHRENVDLSPLDLETALRALLKVNPDDPPVEDSDHDEEKPAAEQM